MKFSLLVVIFPLAIFDFASLQQFKYIKIGGIFPENSADLVDAFQNAIRYANTFSNTIKLQTVVTNVDTSDSFKVQKAVCDMTKNNALGAIFGPNSPKTAGVVSSICKKLRIPHFTAFFQPINVDDFNSTDSFTRNLFPHAKQFSTALMEIVTSLRWMKFAIVYDSDANLEKLQDTLNSFARVDNTGKPSVSFYKLPTDSNDYKPLLKSISKSGISQIMIDCTFEHTSLILKQSSKVGMMNEYVSYFTGIDGYTLDLTLLPEKRANITTIRFFAPETLDIYNYEYPPYFGANPSYKPKYNSKLITTEAALIQDAVKVFSKAFGDNATFVEQFNMYPASCYEPDQLLSDNGKDILNNVDGNYVQGLTYDIRFDEDGQRDLFYIELLELGRSVDGDNFNIKTAIYDSRNGITLLRNFSKSDEQTTLSMQAKEFKVIIRDTEPFVQKRKENVVLGQNETINDLYKGFAIDLIKHLAIECKFRYTIRVTDMKGGKVGDDGQWTGIVKEIIDKRADLAIGDITVTYARKSVMDFSQPFKTLGISILFIEPKKERAGSFAFMDPLSTHVWMHMATAFLCISITEFLLAKMAANDWENPHPCDEDPEELENIWNMHNCIWLTVGSIMQQGCDILPKGVPTRLAAAAWWFFALIVISSYTANLAAFLTKEQMEESIGSVEDLAVQNKIRYGLQSGGSTEDFFKYSNYSTYQKMWASMENAEPSVFVESNEEGVERVRSGNKKFAFFMESAPIEYEIHRNCNLTQVGGLLDSKEYAIGMPLNSPYRTTISQGLLRLKESGKMDELINNWWKQKDEDGVEIDCSKGNKEQSDTPELNIQELGGIFLVLAVGILISILLGILEFIWSIRRTSIDERITPYEAFKKELKFAVSVWKFRKPVAQMSSAGNSMRSSISNEETINDIPMRSTESVKQNGFN